MPEKKSDSDVCVLVMSCDSYSDLWEPFFHFFEKHWPDCPFKMYLATNSKSYSRQNVEVLHSNFKGTWSEETLRILNLVPHQRIIYLQDDYLLLKKVDSLLIKSLLDKMRSHNARYLRLFPSPGPDRPFKDEKDIGEISPGADYRTSLQCAVWDRKTFISLLDPRENQWQFEANSPQRSRDLRFLSVWQKKGLLKYHTYPITYYYLTAVLRGRWRWEAAQICKSEGILLDPAVRQTETRLQFFRSRFYDALPLPAKKIYDFISSRFIKA